MRAISGQSGAQVRVGAWGPVLEAAWAPAVVSKCPDPAVSRGRGWRPVPVLGAGTSRDAVGRPGAREGS
ncbi:hypothetical protein NDU88_008502 [Pleurodeles waltl]|uniref:Uncharacterized protein n=1 Tax=Pleurodeles waltl TaxID=8319 RepID=A0AAV7RUT8_PLEWA|nr:hypothetical protein NDU88_008502 [Pleurodeles waltl]